jgi:hypothetical protein
LVAIAATQVRFVETHSWCGWDNNGANCHGASTHRQFTQGQTYDMQGNAIPGFVYFNSCSREGGCSGGGGDGVGFGGMASWLDKSNDGGCYGGCYNHVSGSSWYWGSSNELIANTQARMTYWWKPTN